MAANTHSPFLRYPAYRLMKLGANGSRYEFARGSLVYLLRMGHCRRTTNMRQWIELSAEPATLPSVHPRRRKTDR